VFGDDFGEAFLDRFVVVDIDLREMDLELFLLGDLSDLSAALQITQGATTVWPARASEIDVARPMPVLDPVTNASAMTHPPSAAARREGSRQFPHKFIARSNSSGNLERAAARSAERRAE
jgi:hypothetical protein